MCLDEEDGAVRVEIRTKRTLRVKVRQVVSHLGKHYSVEDMGPQRVDIIEPHFGSTEKGFEEGHILLIRLKPRI